MVLSIGKNGIFVKTYCSESRKSCLFLDRQLSVLADVSANTAFLSTSAAPYQTTQERQQLLDKSPWWEHRDIVVATLSLEGMRTAKQPAVCVVKTLLQTTFVCMTGLVGRR